MDTGPSDLIVACVLKSGGDFDAEYVERLQRGVTKHLSISHRFVCLSDVDVPCERIELKYDYPGWWSKMELFRPDIPGDIFFLDLDVVITGDLGPLINATPRTARMFRGMDSSAMFLPEHCRGDVWEKWIFDPKRHMADYGVDRSNLRKFRSLGLTTAISEVGDQAFIRRILKTAPFSEENSLLAWFPDLQEYMRVSGPKVLNRPKNPITKKTAAIIFNYYPRPREVNWLEGYLAA